MRERKVNFRNDTLTCASISVSPYASTLKSFYFSKKDRAFAKLIPLLNYVA